MSHSFRLLDVLLLMYLIDKYLPSDYCDVVAKNIHCSKPLSADYIFEQMFCNFPKPVALLMKMRNAIVKLLGLQGGGSFRDLIVERSANEIVICKNDKHLCFWVGVYCSAPDDVGQQNASVTTVVKFNNFLGKIYFIAIWLFHKILVKSLFRKSIREV